MGDVSWRVPTVQLSAATWVPGTPAHTWQAVAAPAGRNRREGDDGRREDDDVDGDGSLHRPVAHRESARGVREARAEFRYQTRLAGRKPALDYRK